MARQAGGTEVLKQAQQQLSKATDAREIRILQAVIFPLTGKTIQETAQAIGRSPRWVTKVRNEFIRNGGFIEKKTQRIRNHAYMTLSQEADFLAPFFEKARLEHRLNVAEVHQAMQKHLGRSVSLSSAYNLLRRHGWYKFFRANSTFE